MVVFMTKGDLRLRNLRGVWVCLWEWSPRMAARVVASSDLILGFFFFFPSQEVEKHICVVCFVKGILDSHKFKIG